jgi:hypothetical protein
MGFLDSLLDAAGTILHEMSKDKPGDIAEWIDSMQESGAAAVNLRRKGKKGVYLVAGAAFDARGNCVDQQTWQIEANTGLKKFWQGDQSGLGELFDWKDEITYDLRKKRRRRAKG